MSANNGNEQLVFLLALFKRGIGFWVINIRLINNNFKALNLVAIFAGYGWNRDIKIFGDIAASVFFKLTEVDNGWEEAFVIFFQIDINSGKHAFNRHIVVVIIVLIANSVNIGIGDSIGTLVGCNKGAISAISTVNFSDCNRL